MEVELFTLFKNYHDESLKKFKKELLHDFMNFFNTTKNGGIENYCSNTKTHVCGYKRSQNRGFCKRLCRDIACSYHIKFLYSDKSDVYDIHEVDISRKNKKMENINNYIKYMIKVPLHENIIYNILKTGKSDKCDTYEMRKDAKFSNLVMNDQFKFNLYNYYIDIFKNSSLVRKNINYKNNIDFSNELNNKLISGLWSKNRINTSLKTNMYKIKKKKYLIEYKNICDVVRANIFDSKLLINRDKKLEQDIKYFIDYEKNKYCKKYEIINIIKKLIIKIEIITKINIALKPLIKLYSYLLSFHICLINDNYLEEDYIKCKRYFKIM